MGVKDETLEAAKPIADTNRQGKPKVSRQDWLTAARNTLVSEGVGEVKILTLSAKLGVARSSFYWYFGNRGDLLDALLDEWEARNTRSIVEKCALPTGSIGEAACNFFRCFIDDALFDQGLDFAVREWARRDPAVRAKIDAADRQRIAAVTEVFKRHDFAAAEADARARILYFMQLGYHAVEVRETMRVRMGRLENFLLGFTGEAADPAVIAEFEAWAMGMETD